jgi:hypothetical protein
MISENFSIARSAVEFIYEQREAESPVRRELISRIVGVALSALLVIDFAIHLIGAIESTFYAIYRGLVDHQPLDFSLPLKHLKCLLLFISQFPSASFIGLIRPDVDMFAGAEHGIITAIRGLLLSHDLEQYTKDNHISWLYFMKYIQSLADRTDKEGMEETLSLLKGAMDLREDFSRLEFRETFSNPIRAFLSDGIKSLLQKDSTLFERIVFKECLSRILALGLSLVAAIEFLFHCVGFFEVPILKILFGVDELGIGNICKEMGWNIALSIIGILFGSLLGIISPALGRQMVTLNSNCYDSVRFSWKDIYEKVLTRAKNLEEGASLLVPIVLPYSASKMKGWSNHAITLLVSKEGESYSVSIINKSRGAPAENFLNQSRVEISEKDLSEYFLCLFQVICMSSDDLYEKAEATKARFNAPSKTSGEACVIEIIDSLYRDSLLKKGREPENSQLFCNRQNSGDCPKASFLGGLRYHNWKQHGHSDHYKTWVHNIKKRAIEEDVHLLDIALGSPLTKKRPSQAAKERLAKHTTHPQTLPASL